MKVLGTPASAGWLVGLIGYVPAIILIFWHEYRSSMKARKNGEGFVADKTDVFYDENAVLPHWILPVISIAALFIIVNAFSLPLETAMLIINLLSVVLLWKYLPHKAPAWTDIFSTSFKNAGIAILNPVGWSDLPAWS